MYLNRNDVAGEVLTFSLQQTKLGVVVMRLTGIDVVQVASFASKKLNRKLYVAAIGYPITSKDPNLTIVTDIESAVAWRSQPSLAGHIVVFVERETKKLHSLSDLSRITARDLAHNLINAASNDLAHNRPQQDFWSALSKEASTFPLKMVEDFVQAIFEDNASSEAIPENLWRIGLLRDEAILQSNRDPLERLRRNRELLMEMAQLSNESRKRMTSALALATGDEQRRLRTAFHNLMDFFRRGGTEILQRLDVPTVEVLLKAGRPLPSARPLIQGTEVPDNEYKETLPPERPLRGRSLQQAVAQLVVTSDPETESGLRELGESIRRSLRDNQSVEAITITPGFSGRTVQPELAPRELREFIGYACNASSWGGILQSTRAELKDAIRSANQEEFLPYDPNNTSQGVAGHSLFTLLESFDSYLGSEKPFTEAINNLIAARQKLLKDIDLLLADPFILLGGYPESRISLNEYLSAYATLLSNFRRHEASLHSHDASALRFVATELLRLDVVHIRTSNEWKAILNPIHPFHLWRYREILNAIQDDSRPLTNEEQSQLAKALPDLPHLLHFLVFSPEVTNGEEVFLPQSGSWELLPTYENHTNRYLGTDGLSFITDLLRRWLENAPYSRHQIRLALVDVPDLASALSSFEEFLGANANSTLVIDAYFTRGQYAAGELARLDYDNRDHEIAKLLLSGKLTIHLHSSDSIAAVVEALSQRPTHIAFLFDQSQYQLSYAPRARQLLVSPLVITYQYEYSEQFKRGTIAPSSEADEGLFADFHFLVESAAHLPAGKQIRLQYEDDINLEPINTLLQGDGACWLAIADRVLTSYRIQGAVPLNEQRIGQREIAVWSKASSRVVDRFVDLLRRYNLRPDGNIVAQLLQRFGHISTGGLFALPMTPGSMAAREAREKGLIGTVLAAAWYTTYYPHSLVASLDSNLARQWLQSRQRTGERADLIGLRLNEHGRLVIEPLEVKTRADGAEVKIGKDAVTGKRRLEGRAIDQLVAMLEALEPIFGGSDKQPLFTPARREVLKYQLHRECFREVHESTWQKNWYKVLQKAFTVPQPSIAVNCYGTVIHVQLEENRGLNIIEDQINPLSLVKIGTKTIQYLISHSPEPKEPIVSFAVTQDDEDISEKISKHKEAQTQGKPTNSTLEPQKQNVVTHQSVVKDLSSKSTEREANDTSFTAAPTININHFDRSEADELGRLFRRACQSYHIRVDECDHERAVAGPTVWRFYVRLARGQRVDPLRNSLEDIGREMRRSGLLVTSIINSDEIAVDIPRTVREIMPLMRGLLNITPIVSPEQMPIPIGVTPEGQDIVQDLGKMPHLLVGGTTGAGKTVFLYGVLAALLQTHPDPSMLRILLSTSGLEDFSFFEGLPHIETGHVIADAREAVDLLQTHVTSAFEERQELLTEARCRDIGEYNARNKTALAPLVVIVDEFADLADQLVGSRANREAFYTHLRRIAQLGRKRGVHLILCTQRPSADLVPTNIRTLMNGRVSLKVNDAAASRMILDETGAEQLQMHGDLLFREQSSITRAQGYHVDRDQLIGILSPFKKQKRMPKRK